MNFNVNIDTKEEMAATSATMDPAGNGKELPEHSGSGGTPNPDLMSKEKSNPKESGSSSTQSKTPGGEGLTDGGAHGHLLEGRLTVLGGAARRRARPDLRNPGAVLTRPALVPPTTSNMVGVVVASQLTGTQP